jgi:WD40 repeat protein
MAALTDFFVERKVVATFDQPHQKKAADGDCGVYIFDITATADSRLFAASLSDKHIVAYDAETSVGIYRVKAHSNTINAIETSKTSPFLIYSASSDRKACVWDLRIPVIASALPVLKFNLPDEVNAVSVGMGDTLLAAGCGTSITFFDVRSCASNSSSSSSSGGNAGSGNGGAGNAAAKAKLGEYADLHTDIVTQVR